MPTILIVDSEKELTSQKIAKSHLVLLQDGFFSFKIVKDRITFSEGTIHETKLNELLNEV